ncbi:HAD-IIA family hydrolase [Prevotella sp. A2931]|uniref:HAD-IIA family hydrolase n=1 Tax=Prevotella illustrans TaxID=2800387 RepID=A0ABS3M503_9BACT|nr:MULTISPECIES: HAD-IIA family hydrolase [Prevotella]MBO1363252.1 HAD-IIA family hydrolase [Prevotella illustrans]PTL27349.1 hydrolase [Prevotella sp. oral taxon 820]
MTHFDKYSSPLSEEKLMEACAKIKHVALDMDGTIYLGGTLFPYTKGFLATLTRHGISYSFLTNNPTKSSKDYLAKLARLGIEATEEQMYTSSIATIDHIRLHYPKAKRLFCLGTPSMQAEFEKAGFTLCEDSADDRPDILVVAFDMTLVYSRLCRAAWWASKADIPYIATNPDWVCPTDEETILVDCGSICKAIEGATKRRPDIVIGKPNPNMLYCIRDKYGLKSDEIAMCGDRIYTDVATAQNAGSLGVLVLSGETTLEMSLAYERQPDITALNIEEFGKLLLKSHRE